MNKQIIAFSLGLALAVPLAYASQGMNQAETPNAQDPVLLALEWDDIEDAAEDVGSGIEKGWEKVEDAVIPETEEERLEEEQERREDAAEEAEEERQKR